jgi:putative colanic acid biosynthesis UDP-glucose lipid carrier transferase
MFDSDTHFEQIVHKPLQKGRFIFYPMFKRAIDLTIVALVALPVGCVLLGCAIAIKLLVGGPVFFWQMRYGINRMPFHILKLRTMTVAETGSSAEQATIGDLRVTAVGKVLRRLSLDELPQLWNVAKGEMSIVGPRPHATVHDDSFGSLIPNYDRRFTVKPGITGLAQVRGLRGPTPTVSAMKLRIKSDLEYVARVSFWMDVRILLQTVVVVFRRTNAL